MTWKNTDPRLDIHKRADIVIIRLRHYSQQACVAQVETKHGWYIHTGFEEPYHRVGSGDDWNPDWQWAFAPSRNE